MGDTADDHEKLFLLEVLVDSLFMSNSSLNLDKTTISNLADTCVLFQFLHYPPLVVCESDFIGSPAGRFDGSSVTFKSGKSCFFSLRLPKGPVQPVPFDVNVSVSRKLNSGPDDKVDIGKTCITMGDMFTELLRQNTDDNLSLSKTKKGTFELKDRSSRTVGSLVAFLRLSCFGKLIITQFSLNKEDEKSFLFKGTDVNKLCGTRDDSKPCGDKPTDVWNNPPGRESLKPPIRDPYDKPRNPPPPRDFDPATTYGTDFGGKQFCPVITYEQRARPCGCPLDARNSVVPPPPIPPPPTRRYGAPGGRGELCNCSYPVPPNVMSEYSRGSQRTDKNIALAPGEVGLQDDQVVFQLPLKKPGEPATERDKQLDSSVYYKLTSAEETPDGRQKNTVHVNSNELPGMGQGAIGPVSGLPVDDKHDVFLLKIGKKTDGDKKRNLELELRTPKMKEPKPPSNEQSTQYLESDCQPEEGKRGSKSKKGGKKSKDKGKKGKSKKGKK